MPYCDEGPLRDPTSQLRLSLAERFQGGIQLAGLKAGLNFLNRRADTRQMRAIAQASAGGLTNSLNGRGVIGHVI